MNRELNGICVAGNMIVDAVKNIRFYPDKGMLADITGISKAVGGCAPNTSVDLAKIDSSLSVSAMGLVGDDGDGRFIIDTMKMYGVNTDRVKCIEGGITSFTDVMNIESGERTFFTYHGANASFCPDEKDISSLDCRIFHIGYILLLDELDAPDCEYGTKMARLLHSIQKRGIKTSIDAVSSNDADYGEKIVPALRYADYAIINEIECCSIWGASPRNADGSLNVNAVSVSMEKMMESGSLEKVIVHSKEAGFCLDRDGTFTCVGSLIADPSLFKGSVGAGDAYCAGCLYGIYNGFSDREILEFASAAALCNLFEANSIDGMKTKDEIMRIKDSFGRVDI